MSCNSCKGGLDSSKYIVNYATEETIIQAINDAYSKWLTAGNIGSVTDFILSYNAIYDNIAPSIPINLSSSNISLTGVTLSWSASTDNIGVIGYNIYQDGVLVNTSASTSFNVAGLVSSTQYSFTVSAYDSSGNISEQSSPEVITTLTPDIGSDPIMIYEFQFDNTSSDSSIANTIDQAWLDANATLVPLANITGAGITINYTGVGRIGFAIANVASTGEFEIRNALDVVITASTFDTPYYNVTTETEILISKNIITPSNVFFKFIEL